MPDSKGTILLVEDDPNIAGLVELYLSRDGHRVLVATEGLEGLRLARSEGPRMVILDIGLPGGIDGFEVCRQLRASSNVPVLFLTARDDEIDRVLGLELGGDDYLTKPFSPRELAARVKAILRRTEGSATSKTQGPEPVNLGALRIDQARREVAIDGHEVDLTVREFDLLWWLVQNQGMVLSRRQLLDGAWGERWYGDERTVDVHIAQLRKKLGEALPLVTVRGVGYRLG
jgi:DNA-binding response OmpR family regulator